MLQVLRSALVSSDESLAAGSVVQGSVTAQGNSEAAEQCQTAQLGRTVS